jgi:tetratricopeptide (TPR) repeat protein
MRIGPALLIAVLLLGGAAHANDPALPAPAVTIRDALRGGDLDTAVDAGQRAIKQFPDNGVVWWWAGRAFGQQAMAANFLMMPKWAARSRDAFERAVELEPAHIEARYDLMSYYLMAPGIVGGGRDKAEAQAAAIAALDASMGKLAAARLAGADKEPERAQALIAEALALDSENHQARVLVVAAAIERKDWAAARAEWATQLECDKHRAFALYQLGRIAALSGEELESGLAQLDAYIAAEEGAEGLTRQSALWRRGQILEQLGRRDEAIASLERAVDDKNIGKQAKADLERLRKG